MALTGALLETLRDATFSILDAGGHPVCCGFFVTPCGVALTAAHACEHARPAGTGRAIRASTHLGQEFSLEVVSSREGDLDVAVLRVFSAADALPPRSHLPLPSMRYTALQLLGGWLACTLRAWMTWTRSSASAAPQ